MRVSFGMARTVEASASLPTWAPRARSQTVVAAPPYSGNNHVRASSMIRSVAHACSARMPWTRWCPPPSPMLSKRTSVRIMSASDAYPARPASGSQMRVVNAASGNVAARCSGVQSTNPPTITAMIGSSEMPAPAIAYSAVKMGRGSGRASHGPRALPMRMAGLPDQRSPAGTSPSTVEPEAISAPSPMRAFSRSVDRAPIRARSPISTVPMRSVPPSIQ